MSQAPIELKGSSFTLSVVHLHNSQPEVIRPALIAKVEQAPAFLKNAPVVINITDVNGSVEWREMLRVFNAAGLHVIGVSGCRDEAQKQAVLHAGLPLLSEGKNAPKIVAPSAPVIAKTKIITTPVRSGQQIYARNGDLIVTGHVSAGAELIADGNIHVYGMMRGRALAGAGGESTSQIFCSHLAAELVSIAGQYWLSEQIPENYYGQAARLSLSDGTLTIQSLF
ncbi:septum site-determining protein MinC [Edwardsiella hoshinae]|uniref:Probable septum site-determining protein MinC n=1 Tax=Edwardsiella hoshinae TaxID=93378 RepID=A0A376DG70_9GAMM|nr:septum site-determining protein MinC [Edwardsiella hoshinae]AOV97207.1 septum site-determining protein MinC [Edwardsiella hoshinae]QPR26948.1 septum site-determining protein MinC [Edwardsiella hoshinae]STC88977.1 Septum site-determining protein MinC [Edwardsiella hoshinae]